MNAVMDTPKTVVSIGQSQLKALLLHIPKADIRKYLNGLHIFKTEGGPCIAEATDGKQLLRVVVSEDSYPFDVIVPRALVVEASASKYAFFEIEGDSITLPVSKVTFQSLSSEGKYPDCERVLPMQGSGMFAAHTGEFCLNNLLLASKALDLLKGAKAKTASDLVRAPKLTYSLDKAESALAADLASEPLGRSKGYERTPEEIEFLRQQSQRNATGVLREPGYAMAVMPLRA